MDCEALTLTTSTLFLTSFRTLAADSPQILPPPSVEILTGGSSLPPLPSSFPVHKLIPNTRFIVDGFRAAGDLSVCYFLSHFHSDHYTGLNPNWCRGIIFCSEITARLLVEILKVSSLFVYPLPLSKTVTIDGSNVTLVEANHCPGAVQFLFEVGPERYIHTGDFRFHDSMKLDPFLQKFVGADALFLDTTYCNPKFVFPSQEDSIDYVVNAIRTVREDCKGSSDSVLFLIATYVVGKERILLEIARRCHCLLHVDRRKMDVLSVLGLGGTGVFTEDASASDVHVIGWNVLGEVWPYFRPNFVKMKEFMVDGGYSKAVGFVSTGWMHVMKGDGFAVRVKESLEIHLVPYSEHSNYDELREYVRFLRPKRVIPTVAMDAEKVDGKHVIALQKHFRGLVDETSNKHDFLIPFHQKRGNSDAEKENSNPTCINELAEPENLLKEGDVESTSKELHDCLPSWVNEDQIMSLIRDADGDIVQAVSNFFERETEFFKLSNASKSLPRSQITVLDNSNITQKSDPTFSRTLDFGNKNSSHGNYVANGKLDLSSSSLKRKVSCSVNKTKKKGKSSSNSVLCGPKQSTITNFFGKAAVMYSDDGSMITAQQPLNKAKLSMTDSAEPDMDKVDQLLQVINNNIDRNAAAILMEEAKGNIDVALDMYYHCSDNVPAKEMLMPDNTPNDNGVHAITYSRSCRISNNLSVRETSSNDTSVTAVMLPIEKYSPIEHACWKDGEPAPYLHLVRTFELAEQEKGKIKTTALFCNMFRSLLALSPADVLPAVYLCTNRIAADHENMELNIGGGLVIAALKESCGTSKSRIKEMYNSYGDLGDVAQECRHTQKLLAPPPPLSICNLFSMLRRISAETGSGSTVRRKNVVVNLMRCCREMEMKFLVRTLVRNLRIGAMIKTILPALSQAVVLNSHAPVRHVGFYESLKPQVQVVSTAVTEAYNVFPNLNLLIPSLLSKGIEFSASALAVMPGTPIPSMLARITNGVGQVLKLFQSRAFTCEYKYDGQRAQIHKLADGTIRIFSRSMKESTFRFPDLITIVKEYCDPAYQTFILDAEIVAVDRKNGSKLMSFQELSSRERGGKDSSVIAEHIKVDICVFIFDIMLLNAERLLASTLRQRREHLKSLVQKQKPGYLELAMQLTVEADEACVSNETTLAKINSFFEDACNSSCEGIMVKLLDIDAGYSASKRSETWLKVKRDYVEGLGDSFDLVPIGAWHGNGRKAGWYSPFLMACYNPDSEEFQSVCRVMSGFSDSFYINMKDFFTGERMLAKKPHYYQTDETPELWFSPELVWEIRGADLTISPVHHAAIGLVHPSRGISVRLPRFIRALSDRKPEDCTTASDIAFVFQSQTRKMEISKQN
ncbi:DNA ligase 1 [Apostasia shenzhenica]|uniref:DNA ligase n=1 Tax=Apostasia shenzhenica TaxID=1088818 RepID=A0A2I0AVY7_9ASPA|nr:DNA ligase 1 [Apostasia shenzhenica]